MKKIFGLIGLVGLVLSSCSNDEIGVKGDTVMTPEPTKNLTLNISTTSGYESYGLDYYTSQALTSDSHNSIGVKTYLYDAGGSIVDSTSTYTKTFTQVDQTFAGLKNGTYTAVTVETIVNTDNHNRSDYWFIRNADQLSTLAIEEDTANLIKIPWYGSIAVATKSISVTGSDVTASLSPEPVGAQVDVYYLDFDKSNYALVALYTKNKPIGMRLSPDVRESEKYIYDRYLGSNTWTTRSYRYPNGGFTESQYGESVYILEQGSINWCFGHSNADDIGHFTEFPEDGTFKNFQNGKTYYAGFCYSGGASAKSDCQAYIADTFSELQNWYGSIEMNWNNNNNNPSSSLFQLPYVQWGGSVSSVQSYMVGFQAGISSPELLDNGLYVLWYYGSGDVDEYDYYFRQSNGDLYYVNMFLNSSVAQSAIEKQLEDYGYNFAMTDDEVNYYLNSSNNTVAAVLVNSSGYWVVQFYENSSSARGFKAHKDTMMPSTHASKKYVSSKNTANNRIGMMEDTRMVQKANLNKIMK